MIIKHPHMGGGNGSMLSPHHVKAKDVKSLTNSCYFRYATLIGMPGSKLAQLVTMHM